MEAEAATPKTHKNSGTKPCQLLNSRKLSSLDPLRVLPPPTQTRLTEPDRLTACGEAALRGQVPVRRMTASDV